MTKFSASKMISDPTVKRTPYKERMAEACDGQEVHVSPVGVRTITGTDGHTYWSCPEWED